MYALELVKGLSQSVQCYTVLCGGGVLFSCAPSPNMKKRGEITCGTDHCTHHTLLLSPNELSLAFLFLYNSSVSPFLFLFWCALISAIKSHCMG